MSWADRAIEQLKDGKTVVIQPRGHSMEPRVKSGQKVTLEPVELTDLQVDDIVLCKVKGNVYLHLVRATDSKRVLIGNNRGHVNGWTTKVYGKMVGGE